MSLAARCPWCETVFRLTKEQAAVRAGMARCGICNHTFNALDYLVRESDLGALSERRFATPGATAAPLPEQPLASVPLAEANDPNAVLLAGTASGHAEPSFAEVPSSPVASEDATRTEPTLDAEPPDTFTIGDGRLSEPSFLRSARGDDEGSRSAGTRIWGILVIPALVVLLGQAAFVWRSELVSWVPQLRQPFEKACVTLRCRVEPPADISMISIESSALEGVPGRKDTMTFSALLHNRSDVPGRYPAIELTLTDAQDRPMIRRVVQSGEYLSATDKLHFTEGLAPNSELPVKLVFEVAGGGVSGYRVAVFYP